MKFWRRNNILLCAIALVFGIGIPAASAMPDTSVTQYPTYVEEYMDGDQIRIQKVYQLSLYENPATIPIDDFERNGKTYTLLDMTQKNEVGVDTQPFTKTITLSSDTNKMEDILKRLEPELEVTTEEHYTGLLRLDHTSVKVSASGYSSKTKQLSATRTYPNLSDADLALIPKSIEENGNSLVLVNVDWSSTGELGNAKYTATASYSGSTSYRYATGYTVSADYTGQVVKTECDMVTYTAIFAETSSDEEPASTDDSESGNASKAPVTNSIPIAGAFFCGGCMATGIIFLLKKIRKRGQPL